MAALLAFQYWDRECHFLLFCISTKFNGLIFNMYDSGLHTNTISSYYVQAVRTVVGTDDDPCMSPALEFE